MLLSAVIVRGPEARQRRPLASVVPSRLVWLALLSRSSWPAPPLKPASCRLPSLALPTRLSVPSPPRRVRPLSRGVVIVRRALLLPALRACRLTLPLLLMAPPLIALPALRLRLPGPPLSWPSCRLPPASRLLSPLVVSTAPLPNRRSPPLLKSALRATKAPCRSRCPRSASSRRTPAVLCSPCKRVDSVALCTTVRARSPALAVALTTPAARISRSPAPSATPMRPPAWRLRLPLLLAWLINRLS